MKDLFGNEVEPEQKGKLARDFGIPPFSILNAREGDWQARKRAWLALGIESELGRGENVDASPGGAARPACDDSKRERGDGRGRPLLQTGRSPARSNGQDLMKGENENFARKNKSELQDIKGGLTFQGAAAGFDYYRVKEGARQETQVSGTSIFDPVLCELAYRWFCPPDAHVLDPFAGGSVRGIVAAKLGYGYTGIDLRPEQIAANEEQRRKICPEASLKWVVGDAQDVKQLVGDQKFGFVFSCPPYFDLEQYSDDPKDLSNMSWEIFVAAYQNAITQAVSVLKDDRFACFVVGDMRDKQGFYRNFPAITIKAFYLAGAKLYNEAILITAVGSLPIRIGRQFGGYRKLGKTHQNILVFFKGNPKSIKENFGNVETKTDLGV